MQINAKLMALTQSPWSWLLWQTVMIKSLVCNLVSLKCVCLCLYPDKWSGLICIHIVSLFIHLAGWLLCSDWLPAWDRCVIVQVYPPLTLSVLERNFSMCVSVFWRGGWWGEVNSLTPHIKDWKSPATGVKCILFGIRNQRHWWKNKVLTCKWKVVSLSQSLTE